MVLKVLFPLLLWFLSAAVATSANLAKNTNCSRKCGNITIPYPFGMGEDPTCFLNEWFKITCEEGDASAAPSPKAKLVHILEVLSISLLDHEISIRSSIGEQCMGIKNKSGSVPYTNLRPYANSPYKISNTRNKFTAIGCNFLGFVEGNTGSGHYFQTGCYSYCSERPSAVLDDGSCTGSGCCHSSIPEGLLIIEGWTYQFGNQQKNGTCRYTMVHNQDQFSFSSSYIQGDNFLDTSKNMQMVVDWVAGNETCESAKKSKTTYACRSEHSDCTDSIYGYRCNCSSGYEGNPYIDEGCKDIDECLFGNPCEEICTNKPGSYSCSCPKGKHGDGIKGGKGCIDDVKEFPILKVVLGTGLGFLVSVIGSSWTYWIWRKRKITKLKEKFFEQNGGFLLQQKISTQRAEAFKIFTAEELERATDNYNANNIVGQGGYGIVYKGILPERRVVAIKKSKIMDTTQTEQFINEVDILSQINHRNVVKLLGCCLEAQVPLLVYEFVSNGSLAHYIHDLVDVPSMSLENRLRIAVEIAEALAYLHSAASMPIFHRDVKSANILLDNNFTAKVSDFGASRLVPIDQTQLTTLVQGTLGYLDPEYFQTGQLTAKSDVYSFGVVLLELLTGEKPVCLNRSEEERNLAMYFILAMKENRLFQVLEDRVLREGDEEQLKAIARLAKQCLKLKGEERPTMKEVAMELQGLRRFKEPDWINNNSEETESLLVKNVDVLVEMSSPYPYSN